MKSCGGARQQGRSLLLFRKVSGVDSLRSSAFICGSFLCVSVPLWGASSVLSAPAAPVQLQSALRGDRSRSSESELGNLVADALRAATGADIALVAAGELREASLPPGNVTPEQLKALLVSAEEPVTVLSLNGATIRSALEVGVDLYPRKNKAFLQV